MHGRECTYVHVQSLPPSLHAAGSCGHACMHAWVHGCRYTAQNSSADAQSVIAFARSKDGLRWERDEARGPVLLPGEAWEERNVMCPEVLYNAEARMFEMWYSGGQFHEPNAIGYAVSADGLTWNKSAANPVLRPDPRVVWESHKVTAAHVHRQHGVYVVFYVCFKGEWTAHVCAAASRDGRSGWVRHPANPLLQPTPGAWDGEAVYKAAVVHFRGRLLLYYNGRRGALESIGLAARNATSLLAGFPAEVAAWAAAPPPSPATRTREARRLHGHAAKLG